MLIACSARSDCHNSFNIEDGDIVLRKALEMNGPLRYSCPDCVKRAQNRRPFVIEFTCARLNKCKSVYSVVVSVGSCRGNQELHAHARAVAFAIEDGWTMIQDRHLALGREIQQTRGRVLHKDDCTMICPTCSES